MVTKVTYFRGGKWNKGGCAWLPFHDNYVLKKIDTFKSISTNLVTKVIYFYRKGLILFFRWNKPSYVFIMLCCSFTSFFF